MKSAYITNFSFIVILVVDFIFYMSKIEDAD